MAMAIFASVTVSIADESNGIFRSIDLVTFVRVSAVDGMTDDCAGTSKTSSKVKASRISIGVLLKQVSLGNFLSHGFNGSERG
jgi:hypothetical protein